MTAPPASAASFNSPPTSGGTACTASWNGAATLTDTVTSGGAFMASFGGQVLASVTTPLPGWLSGAPS